MRLQAAANSCASRCRAATSCSSKFPWALVVAGDLARGGKICRFASIVITRCFDRYVARVCPKTITLLVTIGAGLERVLPHRLATAEADRNVGLAGR
jgi:hypothetical protein